MDDNSDKVHVKILFFAKARELCRIKESNISIQKKIKCSELFSEIISRFNLESIQSCLILSVNEEFVHFGTTLNLSENDEIAVIPPLSGVFFIQDNMDATRDIVKLQEEELDIRNIINEVITPECGAISSFIGITRDNFENKKVLKLEYEAYESMAIKQIRNICTKIRSQWEVGYIAIYHRLGEVPVSQASVVIAISSPHRQESLHAVEYAINELKATVPIWKKEIYDSNEAEWKKNKECTWSNCNKEIQFWRSKVETCTQTTDDQIANANSNEETNSVKIDPNVIQVQASPNELNQRIESFIARKRQQVNIVNIQEFCCHRDQDNKTEDSCARVDAILIRRKDSKSHVKVHRVLNTWGPQTVDQTCMRSCIADAGHEENDNTNNPVLDERIAKTEYSLGINKPVPKNIYERLKNIEDRVLYLEGICPEYKDFWVATKVDHVDSEQKPVRKRTYSTAELDSKLHELESRFVKKAR